MVVLPLLSPNFQVLPLIWNCGISLSFQLLSLPFSHAVFLHLCFYVSKPDVYLKLLVIIKKKGALIVFFPFLTLKQTDCCVSASEWLSIKARTCVLGCLVFFLYSLTTSLVCNFIVCMSWLCSCFLFCPIKLCTRALISAPSSTWWDPAHFGILVFIINSVNNSWLQSLWEVQDKTEITSDGTLNVSWQLIDNFYILILYLY